MDVARITIVRRLHDDDGDLEDLIEVEAKDASGQGLSMIETLGMLRFAEDSVMRRAMGEEPDDG